MFTPEYAITAAADNVASALQGKITPHFQESSIKVLELLQDIFNQAAPALPPTQSTSKVVITHEIQDTKGKENHTPIPPAQPPTQRPEPPPRVEPQIQRIVTPPRVYPPQPQRVQPLKRSKKLATVSLQRVPPPAPRTNVRKNQIQAPAHNTRSKKVCDQAFMKQCYHAPMSCSTASRLQIAQGISYQYICSMQCWMRIMAR